MRVITGGVVDVPGTTMLEKWITGFANYVLDPGDPFPNGFTVGDIWP